MTSRIDLSTILAWVGVRRNRPEGQKPDDSTMRTIPTVPTTTNTSRTQLRVIRGGKRSPAPAPLTFTTTLAKQIDAAITFTAIEAVRALHPDWAEDDIVAEALDMRRESERELTLDDIAGMLADYTQHTH